MTNCKLNSTDSDHFAMVSCSFPQIPQIGAEIQKGFPIINSKNHSRFKTQDSGLWRFPADRADKRRRKNLVVDYLLCRGSSETESFFLPLARRALSTLRPSTVDILSLNPCLFFLFVLDGWYVLFMTDYVTCYYSIFRTAKIDEILIPATIIYHFLLRMLLGWTKKT